MESPEGRKLQAQPASKQKTESSIKTRFPFIFRRSVKDYVWTIIILLWIGAFILGYVGLSKATLLQGENRSPLDLIYLNLQLVILGVGDIHGPVPWELEIARFTLPALAAYTAIQAFAFLFREQIRYLRLWFIRDHVVVCGLSRKGVLLIKSLLQQGFTVVVIELDEGNDLIEQLRIRGAIILVGDATDQAVLRQARVEKAKYLLAVCDDGVNAEIVVAAQRLVESLTRDPLTCIIHIVDPRLCDLLRESEIRGKAFSGLRLELFNVFERGAQLLMEEYPPFDREDEKIPVSPHILIIGMGKMGENLILRIAHAWHSMSSATKEPLYLTVIDLKALEKIQSLEMRYPRLAEYCEIRALSMDVYSSDFYKAEFLIDRRGRHIDLAYVCLDNDSLNLQVGLTLEHLTQRLGIPIILRMIEERGLASLLRNGKDNCRSFQNIHAFSLLNKTCTPELLFGGIHEMLARSVHEDYLRQQRRLRQLLEGNETLAPWDQLPEKIKDSNRRYADHISLKLQAVDCYLAPLRDWNAFEFSFTKPEVELMAEMEHERWVLERRQEGWSYAEQKDDDRKVHPSLILWEKLPDDEKEKNRAFIHELPHILAKAGFQVQRDR